MLEKIRELAMEKLASEEEVNAFMEGFEKAATEKYAGLFGGGLGNLATTALKNEGIQRAAIGLGAGLLGAAVVKGISSGSNAVSNYSLRQKFEVALAQVMANNRVVKGSKPEKAKDYAETLFKFAPHVASDPNLLSSILANAVLGEGIDPMTIKNLVDLEGRYKDNSSPSPLIGIKH